MFNFLKSKKDKSIKSPENVKEVESIKVINPSEDIENTPNNEQIEAEINNLRLSDSLAVIKHLITEKQPVPSEILQQKLNISEESLQNLASEFNLDLNSENFAITLADSIEEFLTLSEKPEELAAAWDDLKDYKENKTKKFLNSPFAKAMVVAAVLAGKSMGVAASEHQSVTVDQNQDNTTISAEENTGLDYVPDNTINWNDAKNLSAEIQELKDASQIEISNYFETNTPNISEENKTEIQNKVFTFLDKLTPLNLDQFINNNKVNIFVSSDERVTNYSSASGNGNEALSIDRAQSIKTTLSEVFSHYNFNDKEFSSEQIEKINNFLLTDINIEIPDGGILSLDQIENPNTGEKYTQEEIDILKTPGNENLYLQAIQACRVAKIDLIQNDNSEDGDVIQKISPISPELSNINPEINTDIDLFSNLKEYIDYTIFLDGSPSMHTTQKILAEKLAQENYSKNVELKQFSNKIIKELKVSGAQEAASVLENMPTNNSCDEKALDLLLANLKNLPDPENENDKKLYTIVTDEPLYYSTLVKLEELSKLSSDKKVDINFIMAKHINNKVDINKINLNEVMEIANHLISQKIAKDLRSLQERVNVREKRNAEYHAKHANERKLLREWDKATEDVKKLLTKRTEEIKNSVFKITYDQLSKDI